MPNNIIEVNQVEFLDKNIHAEVLGNQVTNPKEKRKKKKRERVVGNDEPMRDVDGLDRERVRVWPTID